MRTGRRLGMVTAAVVSTIAAATFMGGSSGAAGVVARTELRDATGTVVGSVAFMREGARVVAEVEALVPADSPTFHGFHIHANDVDSDGDGNAADGCVGPAFTSVDGHWDVGGHVHGDHTGDLPSLLRDAGGHAGARVDVGAFVPGDIIGRAVIVHAGPDNFANIPTRYAPAGPDATTLATGDSGTRYACGVIRAASR